MCSSIDQSMAGATCNKNILSCLQSFLTPSDKHPDSFSQFRGKSEQLRHYYATCRLPANQISIHCSTANQYYVTLAGKEFSFTYRKRMFPVEESGHVRIPDSSVNRGTSGGPRVCPGSEFAAGFVCSGVDCCSEPQEIQVSLHSLKYFPLFLTCACLDCNKDHSQLTSSCILCYLRIILHLNEKN